MGFETASYYVADHHLSQNSTFTTLPILTLILFILFVVVVLNLLVRDLRDGNIFQETFSFIIDLKKKYFSFFYTK